MWNIETERVSCIITDGASNIKKAAHDTFTGFRHLHCLAHTINLMALAAMKKTADINAIINKVKEIVTYYKHSTFASTKLYDKQMELGKQPLKLIQECITRWNSLYYMLERFIHLFEYINLINFSLRKAPPLLNSNDIDIIQDTLKLMSFFEKVSKDMSSEKVVTCSKILPVLFLLKENIRKINPVTNAGNNLKKNILAEIELRYREIEKVSS